MVLDHVFFRFIYISRLIFIVLAIISVGYDNIVPTKVMTKMIFQVWIHVPRDMTASMFVSEVAILTSACVMRDMC